MKFDFAKTFSAPAAELTAGAFQSLVHSAQLKKTCAKVQAAIGTPEYAKAKRALPVVMWQSHFADGKRHDASAEPSGLYMLDIDHIDKVRIVELKEAALSAGLDNLGIYAIHVTPSEQGLRFVAKMLAKNSEFTTIAQHQNWLAAQIGVADTEFDTACKDWARASFLPSFSYFLYFNPAIFTDEAEVVLNPKNHEEKSKLDAHRGGGDQSNLSGGAHCEEAQGGEDAPKYRGLSVTDIARNYFDATGGMPVEGERHQRFLDAARVLRYICDFKPNKLIAALSPLYDDKEDLQHVCRDACTMTQGSQKPKVLERILQEMTEVKEAPTAERVQPKGPELPKYLPPIFRDYVDIAPADFKDASFLALLPVMGTIFTHLRATYLDGKVKSPSFMTVIEAPQASGKSFLENIVDQMLVHIQAEDDVSWAIWRKYNLDRKANKNKEEQPEEPDAPIRIIPATISITQYLIRQTHCPERHLFSFIPEIATLTRTNSAGAWSQKSELYRLAFDNSKFGQDYASDNSFSGVVKVFYNWLASGTPLDVKKFFKNCEDGLVSRVMFYTLPDQLGMSMPKWGSFTTSQLAAMQKIVKTTGTERLQTYNLDYVNEALEKWLEEKRMLVVKTGDRALDVFRRRSAQMGFIAALIFHHLYIKASTSRTHVTAPQKKRIVESAIYVAERALRGQYSKFAEDLNDIDAEIQERKEHAPSGFGKNILDALPQQFYKADVEAEIRMQHRKSKSNVLISVWKKNGVIKMIETDKYEKV